MLYARVARVACVALILAELLARVSAQCIFDTCAGNATNATTTCGVCTASQGICAGCGTAVTVTVYKPQTWIASDTQYYKLDYRAGGSANWTNFSTNLPGYSFVASGLVPNTAYEFRALGFNGFYYKYISASTPFVTTPPAISKISIDSLTTTVVTVVITIPTITAGKIISLRYTKSGSPPQKNLIAISTVKLKMVSAIVRTATPTIIVVTMNGAISSGATTIADFTVTVAGATVTPTAASTSAQAIDPGTVSLTLGTAVTSGQAVTVAYTKSATASQNLAATTGSMETQAALSVDNQAGYLYMVSAAVTNAAPANVALTMNAAIVSGTAAICDFAVTVKGIQVSPIGITSTSGQSTNPGVIVFTLSEPTPAGYAVTVSYTKSQVVDQNLSSQSGAMATQNAVSAQNTVVLAMRSALVAVTAPTSLVVTMNGAIVSGQAFALDFIVNVDGSAITPGWIASTSGQATEPGTVTFTMPSAVTSGQTLTVAYTKNANSVYNLAAATGTMENTQFPLSVTNHAGFLSPSAASIGNAAPTVIMITTNTVITAGIATLQDFVVLAGAAPMSLSQITSSSGQTSVNPGTISITLTAAPSAGYSITVTYKMSGTSAHNLASSGGPMQTQNVPVTSTIKLKMISAIVTAATPTIIVVTMNGAISGGAATIADFTVAVAGATVTPTAIASTSAQAIDPGTVSLTLGTAVSSGQAVTVAYTKSATPSQNLLATTGSMETQAALSVDNQAGYLYMVSAAVTNAAPANVALTMNAVITNNGAVPTISDFTVRANGVMVPLVSASRTSQIVTLTCTQPLAAGRTFTVTYTKSATVIQNIKSDIGPMQTQSAITAQSTVKLKMVSAIVTAATPTIIVVTMNGAISGGAATIADFAVTVAGATVTPTAASTSAQAIDPGTVSLTLGTAVSSGQAVTVAYTKSATPSQNLLATTGSMETQAALTVTNDVNIVYVASAAVTNAAPTNLIVTMSSGISSDTIELSDFTLSVGGSTLVPAGVMIAGSATLKLSLALSVPSGPLPITAFRCFTSLNWQAYTSSPIIIGDSSLVYVVKGLAKYTTYRFKCQLQNSMTGGWYHQWGPLAESAPVRTIPDLPAAPVSVSVNITGANSLLIAWRSPTDSASAGGGVVLSFIVTLREPATSKIFTFTQKPAKACSFLVSSLDPLQPSAICTLSATGLNSATSYVVYVQAVNEAGTGPLSTVTAAVSTLTGVPTSPTNLQVKSFTARTVDLSWDAPSYTGGSAVIGYDVSFSSSTTCGNPSLWSTWRSSAWCSITSFTVSGLDANQAYKVRVRAQTSAGFGSWSESSQFATKTELPFTPSKLLFVSSDLNSIVISWTAPWNSNQTSLPITTYYIKCTSGCSSSASFSTKSTLPSYKVTGLNAGTRYYFSLAASNALGMGSWSSVSSGFLTATAVPNAPTMSIKSTATFSLSLQWSSPLANGSPITSYDLRYQVSASGKASNASASGTSWTTCATCQEISGTVYTLLNLNANTMYKLQVRASNGVGAGSWSVPGTALTTANVPNAPILNVTMTSTTIDALWSTPVDGGSPILRYELELDLNGDGTVERTLSLMQTTNKFTFKSLAASTKYAVKVWAVNVFGAGVKSAVVVTTSTKPPENSQFIFDLTLGIQYATWTHSVQESLLRSIARRAQVSVDRVQILTVKAGSIVAQFKIISTNAEAPIISTNLQQLYDESTTGNLKLANIPVESMTSPVESNDIQTKQCQRFGLADYIGIGGCEDWIMIAVASLIFLVFLCNLILLKIRVGNIVQLGGYGSLQEELEDGTVDDADSVGSAERGSLLESMNPDVPEGEFDGDEKTDDDGWYPPLYYSKKDDDDPLMDKIASLDARFRINMMMEEFMQVQVGKGNNQDKLLITDTFGDQTMLTKFVPSNSSVGVLEMSAPTVVYRSEPFAKDGYYPLYLSAKTARQGCPFPESYQGGDAIKVILASSDNLKKQDGPHEWSDGSYDKYYMPKGVAVHYGSYPEKNYNVEIHVDSSEEFKAHSDSITFEHYMNGDRQATYRLVEDMAKLKLVYVGSCNLHCNVVRILADRQNASFKWLRDEASRLLQLWPSSIIFQSNTNGNQFLIADSIQLIACLRLHKNVEITVTGDSFAQASDFCLFFAVTAVITYVTDIFVAVMLSMDSEESRYFIICASAIFVSTVVNLCVAFSSLKYELQVDVVNHRRALADWIKANFLSFALGMLVSAAGVDLLLGLSTGFGTMNAPYSFATRQHLLSRSNLINMLKDIPLLIMKSIILAGGISAIGTLTLPHSTKQLVTLSTVFTALDILCAAAKVRVRKPCEDIALDQVDEADEGEPSKLDSSKPTDCNVKMQSSEEDVTIELSELCERPKDTVLTLPEPDQNMNELNNNLGSLLGASHAVGAARVEKYRGEVDDLREENMFLKDEIEALKAKIQLQNTEKWSGYFKKKKASKEDAELLPRNTVVRTTGRSRVNSSANVRHKQLVELDSNE